MARPRKAELAAKLREKGYDVDEMDRYALIVAHDVKRRELDNLEDELNEKLEPARRLTRLLEELRRLMLDSNTWNVIRSVLENPEAITGEATRSYGADHKEALRDTTWLVTEGYITRSELELDPIRLRYVRYQYPGPKLIRLLRELAEAVNDYDKAYLEVLKLKAKIRDAAETLNLLEKYLKYCAGKSRRRGS